ncbi:hypothetical protein CYMTET_14528 [Cymbomonas tetramitiformis]|uniref:Reverse transcriptase domain-containing protein n=1 Tax=Cymbomonas tetramitiformis TaxID=36881 RepID=A0AAE0GG74_9CHLO|nr:hypothetical protein CYMTET_14528 [Cymbomonas tetramitiformis]
MTKLDLRSGFHQIVLTDDASLKTCFWWARDGAAPEQYVYKRMPFGSANSTAMFGRVIEHELRGLSCAKVYCDDILVTSPTARQHLADLEAVMQRLSKVGLRGHPGKSVFAAGGCEFLGFLLRPGKLSPHQAKVAALLELPTPTDVRGVRAILGFMNFYRIMAARIGKEDYSSMAWPLNCLLRKGNENVKDLWGKEHDDALAQLKKRLTEPGVVIHAYDPNRPLYLMTDWSGVGISAILGQKDDEDRGVIIAAASRSLSRSEMRYSSFYGEALAAVYGVSLQEFEYDIVHRAGISHTNADVLSRYPRESSLDPTGASLDPTEEEAALPTAGAFACLCARHPRSPEESTQDITPIASSWQYESHVGRLPGDPCTSHDLVSHHLGEHWSMHAEYSDHDARDDDALTLWEEACCLVDAYLGSRRHVPVTRVLSCGECVDGQATSLDTRPLPQRTLSHLHAEGSAGS